MIFLTFQHLIHCTYTSTCTVLCQQKFKWKYEVFSEIFGSEILNTILLCGWLNNMENYWTRFTLITLNAEPISSGSSPSSSFKDYWHNQKIIQFQFFFFFFQDFLLLIHTVMRFTMPFLRLIFIQSYHACSLPRNNALMKG